MNNKTAVCLTGASGFLGSNLIRYFEKELCQVKHISREWLNNSNAVLNFGATTIIHLAGKAHDLREVSRPEEYYNVNLELTKRLYGAFLASDARKFIFLSSVKAAADHLDEPLTEDFTPNPQTHYGKSKLMAEEYIQSQPLPHGKSYYILRPCMIHGPGNKGNLNLLFKFVNKGIPYPLGCFNNRRSFLSVENLCFIINEIITRDDIPGGIYHIADDDTLSTTEVVSILASSINKKPRLLKIPKTIIMLLAKVGDLLHLPLTTERLNKLTENYVVSNQKIKNALKKILPLTAIEGIKITANSFKEN